MDDPVIDGVALEEVIAKAVRGDQNALRLLLFSPWLSQLIEGVSDRVSRLYQVDSAEVRDFVSEKLRDKIDTLRNPHNRPWRDCLRVWCYTVAKNHAQHTVRRNRAFKQSYRNSIEHENTQLIRDRKRMTALYSPLPSQEDEIEQKEREFQRVLLQAKLEQSFRQVFDSFTPEDKLLLSQWAEGKTSAQISGELEMPISTVYRRLRKLQKAIVEGTLKAKPEEIGKAGADKFFNAAQQERLTELMRLRQARTLSSGEGRELESLIEAEIDGARLRAESKVRQPQHEELSGLLAGVLARLSNREKELIIMWAEGRSA